MLSIYPKSKKKDKYIVHLCQQNLPSHHHFKESLNILNIITDIKTVGNKTSFQDITTLYDAIRFGYVLFCLNVTKWNMARNLVIYIDNT